MAALAVERMCNRWRSSQMLFVVWVGNTGDFWSGEDVPTVLRFLRMNRVFLLEVHCRFLKCLRWWRNESAACHKMAQRVRKWPTVTAMVNMAPVGPAHHGRLWTQHESRKWFWKIDYPHFEIYPLHSKIMQEWKLIFVNGCKWKGSVFISLFPNGTDT